MIRGYSGITDLLLAAGCDYYVNSSSSKNSNIVIEMNKSIIKTILSQDKDDENPQDLSKEVLDVVRNRRGSPQSLRYLARISWIRGCKDLVRKDSASARRALEIPRHLQDYLGLMEMD